MGLSRQGIALDLACGSGIRQVMKEEKSNKSSTFVLKEFCV